MSRPAITRCPTAPRFPGDITGCGSTNLTEPDENGLIDCLNCGIWFDPAKEFKPMSRSNNTGCLFWAFLIIILGGLLVARIFNVVR